LARILLEPDATSEQSTNPQQSPGDPSCPKHLCTLTFALAARRRVPVGCAEPDPAAEADEAIEQVYDGKLTVAQAQNHCRCQLEVVPVGGTVFHFGLDLSQSPPAPYRFQSTVAGARVSIAELPITAPATSARARTDMGLQGDQGPGHAAQISFVYELAGYPTTKSQVSTCRRRRSPTWRSSFRPQAYYAPPRADRTADRRAHRRALQPAQRPRDHGREVVGVDVFARPPHGDPGVQVAISPAIQFPVSLGPVYFNEAVAPDPTLTSTSVDGGVLFGNLASGSHTITASKAPFAYSALTFVVQDRFQLYVASPPHATQGTNDSPPGQP
jgi:hypothetical protein